MHHSMEMAFFFLNVFLPMLIILRLDASPEVGFSARLKSSSTIPAATVTTISDWENRGYSLLFEYGIKLMKGDNGNVGLEKAILPVKGLFLVSANLMVESKQEMKLKVCITKNICQESEQNERTIPIVIQEYFSKNEVIALRVFADKPITVLKDSSFAVQYLGPFSRMAGFLAFLAKERNLDYPKNSFATIKGWVKSMQSYEISKKMSPTKDLETGALTVECTGLYFMTATLSFYANKNTVYKARLMSNKTEVMYMKYCPYDGIATIAFNKYINLNKDDDVSIQITASNSAPVRVLKGGRFAAVYIGKSGSSFAEFVEPLTENTYYAGVEEHTLSNYVPQNVIEKKNIKETMKPYYQITMPRHGVYIITLHLNLKMSLDDTLTAEVRVYERGLKAFTSLSSQPMAVICNAISKKYGETSSVLTGVLALEAHDFVSISFRSSCKDAFMVLKDSWVSFMAVRSHDFVASYSIRGQSDYLLPSMQGLVLNATSPLVFPLSESMIEGKMIVKCPLSGIYLISMNLVVSGSKLVSHTANVQVFRRTIGWNTSKPILTNQSAIFDVNVTIFEGLATISPTFVHILRDGDDLSFHIRSTSKLEIMEGSSLFISLIDFVETSRTFIGEQDKVSMIIPLRNREFYTITPWTPVTLGSVRYHSGHVLKVPQSGFYMVSCYVHLVSKFNVSVDSVEVSLQVYFDDQDRDFGLKDVSEVVGKGNDTVNFFLSVSGVLVASKDATLMTSLRSTKHDINITILASQVSVSFHAPSEDGTETYRTLQSSTKLLAFKEDNREHLDRRVYENTNGEFKSDSVEFLSVRFHAQKSIIAFVCATTVLHGVEGTVQYGIAISTGAKVKRDGLTVKSDVSSKRLKTLKWTGFVYMEPWQQLSLEVRLIGQETYVRNARISWSSLSFMAMSIPDTANQVHALEKTDSISAPSDGWYVAVDQMLPDPRKTKLPSLSMPESIDVMALHNMKNGDVFNRTAEAFEALSLPRFKLANKQELHTNINALNVSRLDLSEAFIDISASTGHFQESHSALCVVGILSLNMKLKVSHHSVMQLVYHAEESNTTLSASKGSQNTLEFHGILCLNSLRSLSLTADTAVNVTIMKKSKLSFVLLDSSNNLEGFSVLHQGTPNLPVHSMTLIPSIETDFRLDGWSTPLFDSTLGFKPPFGTYVAQADGTFLVTANVILKAPVKCNVNINLYRDNESFPIAVAYGLLLDNSVHTINFAALIDLQKWSVLELKFTSNCEAPTNVLAGSSFAIVLLDPHVAFQRCESNLLQLKASNQKQIAKRIGTDIVINCGTSDARTVDFYWLRNGMPYRSIQSSSNGTLVIKSSTYKDSGFYVCRVQTGDFFAVSHKIKVVVYDPTPQVFIKNRTLGVPENSPPHQALIQISVKAATPRETEDALVHLTIEPETMRNIFYFAPDRTRSSAILKSRKQFDYEDIKEYNIVVTAMNAEFAGIAKCSTKLKVKVVDRNDNPPEFEKTSYAINILENAAIGTTILVLSATDKDTGVNAEVLYYLHENADSETFHIGKHTGIITLQRSLEIRRKRSFTLFVIARNGQFSTFAEVAVNIVDINDNRPYFQPTVYNFNVTETTEIGTNVGKILAHDLDIDAINRNITYMLKNPTIKLPFVLNQFGDVIVSQRLDKYAGELFTVKALSRDGHGLKSSNEATILFRVIKTMFFSSSFFSGLRFANDVYRVNIREDAPVGTLVTTVQAFNPDNAYYSLRYIFIKPENNYNFTISESTGEIRTTSCLDYEYQKRYSLNVFACDVDGISECTATTVDINVEDVNDHFPVFAQMIYEVNVNESSEVGTIVETVVASDADSGKFGIVKYGFVHREIGFVFSIGETDGNIRVAKCLSGLNVSNVVFGIKASDNEGRSQEALIDITVLRDKVSGMKSVLDKHPKFEKSRFNLAISEDSVVGTKLADIAVYNPDIGKITYYLLANDNNTFETNPVVGGLYLKKQLDFEQNRAYDLFLIAEYANETTVRSYTRIHVNLIDVNDNRPKFIENNQRTFVTGSLKSGRFVTRVRATDKDSGRNGQIIYSINSNETVNAFSLDPQSGDLRIKTIGNKTDYALPVVACDKGSPMLCDYGMLTVHITKDTFEGGLESTLIDSNYTYAEMDFTLDAGANYTAVRFIAQEVHMQHPLYTQYTQLAPITWHDVYYRRSERNNYLRRYIAAEKSFGFEKGGRARRDSSSVEKTKLTIRFKFGSEDNCGEVWRAEQICNGPLHPGTSYRFQLEIKHRGSRLFLKTGFTKTYKTGPVAVKTVASTEKLAEYTFPFWIALCAVSSVLLLLVIVLLICCCCRRRKRRRRRKNRYEVAIQKDSLSDEHPMHWKTETEAQEFTVWFSEESICNGSMPHKNSNTVISSL